ncbi:1-phosphofructokinase family hexose kinase [Salinimicrobium soli]|uniref:1-phosphofructokinase family hexose kinase n=1 Tax=Salinimicrobium soli TaxID=1254399 RepID=UPI003AAF0E42
MILTLTVNPALDIYSRVQNIQPGEKLRCEQPKLDPGGGGINVSRVIKRLGGSSVAIYPKGGHTGSVFQDLLQQEDIQQDPVSIQNALRENFAVTDTATGELYRFGFPGPELSEVDIQNIHKRLDQYERADFLVASGSLPPGVPNNFYSLVAKKARELNIKFILDTSGKAYEGILEEGAYLLKPNQNELEALVGGRKATNREEQKDLLREVVINYPIEIVILSLGGDGALLATKDEVRHFPAPQVEQISSIGAGDSMVAGVVHGLFQDYSLDQAVLFGLACGSATLKSPGTELLKKKDAEELYSRLQQQIKI